MDPLLVGVGLDRPIHFMARKSLFTHNFLFTRLIRTLNAFPVERDRGDIGAVREMMRRLEAGAVVLTFPESTRTYTGEIGPFKHGVFLIASRSGVPVVPMAIEGAFEAWPRSNILPRPGQIVVACGKPLFPADFGGDDRRMADACREAVLALRDQAREFRQRSGT
jgi:1-acyl-sn-glycerol-3-phosphate acyltransferase